MYKKHITHFKILTLLKHTSTPLKHARMQYNGSTLDHDNRPQLLLVASELLLFLGNRLTDIADNVYKQYLLTTSVKKKNPDIKVSLYAEIKNRTS